MSNLAFVIPGWYKTKNATGDVVQTIRVIGGGDKGNNYFALMDGTEMHENQILDEYEYMPTAMNQDGNFEAFDLGNLDDLNIESKPIHEEIQNTPIQPKTEIHPIHKEIQNKPIQYSEPVQVKYISEDEIFINQLLKQLNIVENNDTVNINFKLNFKYDINKLKQIIKFIDNDNNKINLFIDKLISEDIENIKIKINDSIKNFLLMDDKKILHEKIESIPEQNIVNSNISKYINKHF